MYGFVGVEAKIEDISFKEKGAITLLLQDGRKIIAPLKNFEQIAGLSSSKRKNYTIGNDSIIIFHDLDEVYHVQDFLGVPEDYVYKG